MRDRTNPDLDDAPLRIPGGFRAAFAAALVDVGLKVKQWQGTSVVCLNSQDEESTLSLGNVYRRAQNAPREEWPAIIQEFVQHLTIATEQSEVPTDLRAEADRLRVRIGTPFPPNMGDAAPWSLPMGETGLVQNMVIDHPKFMCYVNPRLLGTSGRGAEEWLEIARRNLIRDTPADYLSPVSDDSGILLGCLGDAYDAARALILDELLPAREPFGFFVAVPTRDVLIVLPVTAEALINVHVLRRFAIDNHKSRPYPISDEVYWVRDGEWRCFPVEITKDSIQVTPPPEFAGVLEALSAPGEEDGGDSSEN